MGPKFLHKMLNEEMKFLDEMEYKGMGNAAGFTQISMTIIDHFPEWKNIDDYIDTMHGWFHGEFDPTQFDCKE